MTEAIQEMTIDEAKLSPSEDLDGLQRKALGVGIVGLIALGIGYAWVDHGDFYRAYLIGWVFCLGIAMGLSALNMLNHVSGGNWGVTLRRVLEASGRTLPLFIVLGIPLAFGLEDLYLWAEPGITTPGSENYDALVAMKAPLLNKEAYIGLSAAILVIWSFFAYLLSGLSRRHDETGDEAALAAMEKWSCVGGITYALTGTLASVLWIMSVDPHWFSSLFGFIFCAGQGLSAFAFAIPTLLFLSQRQPFKDRISDKMKKRLFHDYGKLMLAFTALWAYFMMSQFLIIWSGNLPEEVIWYLDRSSNGWLTISILLVAGHFVIPFILLLSQDLKKNAGRLVWVAGWILAMRWFDLYWQIAPSAGGHGHGEGHFPFTWVEPVVPIAFVGIWLALLISQLKGRAMLPVREPGLQEVIAHG